ncbi:MAG: hypothetical protein GX322_09935 [Firmicutes bacterium]|nr:hypothetical protein [Bacillota bacterium]
MQWREIWGKWWPETKAKGEGLPLTDGQRKLVSYILVFLIGVASFLQFTSGTHSPVIFPEAKDIETRVEPVAGTASLRQFGFEEEVENRLASVLAQMEGVGGTQVLVYVTTGPRLELAHDMNQDKTTTEETDRQGGQRRVVADHLQQKVVILREGQSAGDKPVVVTEHRPTIGGVLVIADGAKDPSMRLRIARAVATAIDIPVHRVEVMARRK